MKLNALHRLARTAITEFLVCFHRLDVSLRARHEPLRNYLIRTYLIRNSKQQKSPRRQSIKPIRPLTRTAYSSDLNQQH